ncbi:hypothetical protein LSAJ18_120365 [Latilactobacillus sakei]|nr:hypothetical protein LSAJ18_120365 [Latilactobacillus sakei]
MNVAKQSNGFVLLKHCLSLLKNYAESKAKFKFIKQSSLNTLQVFIAIPHTILV